MTATETQRTSTQSEHQHQRSEHQKNADRRMSEDKKRLASEREERTKAQEEHRKKMIGRPTPTQEEADLIKLGHHPDLEPDGSQDPYATPEQKEKNKQHHSDRHMESEGKAPYQTRQSTAGGGASGGGGSKPAS